MDLEVLDSGERRETARVECVFQGRGVREQHKEMLWRKERENVHHAAQCPARPSVLCAFERQLFQPHWCQRRHRDQLGVGVRVRGRLFKLLCGQCLVSIWEGWSAGDVGQMEVGEIRK